MVRNLVLSSIKDIGVDCSSMTDEQRKCLFCLGLAPAKVHKSVQRQIFRLVWNVRNEVLFSYERQGVEKVKSLVGPILLRIKNDVHYNNTKYDG